MAIINLRKHYYPLYTKDTFVEVPEGSGQPVTLGLFLRQHDKLLRGQAVFQCIVLRPVESVQRVERPVISGSGFCSTPCMISAMRKLADCADALRARV